MTTNDYSEKPRGYRLADVEPDFRGMPLREWKLKRITSQFEAFIENREKVKAVCGSVSDRAWNKRPEYKPKANYGMRSML